MLVAQFLWLPVVSASFSKLSTMIEPFLGTWKLESSENFEEYLEQLGEKYHGEVGKPATHPAMGWGLCFTG